MFEWKRVSEKELIEAGLDNGIIEVDRLNMTPILAETGLTFREEKRRQGFAKKSTFIIALRHDEIVGYLEYSRSLDNEREIHVSSLQIIPKYRGGALIIQILSRARDALLLESFDRLVGGVLKNNDNAARLYERLGFVVEESSPDEPALKISTSREVLINGPLPVFLERWKKRGKTK